MNLQNFYDWVKKAFTPAYQKEIERYLSQAVDLADLEQRIKTIKYRGML